MVLLHHLDGSIYHMVHFDNLQHIFWRRALLSKEKVLQEKVVYHSIAYENVQSLRNRIFVWSYAEHKFRPLHSYVPFYFATHTPILYVQHKKGIQKEIVLFEVGRSIVQEQGVLFTDGNASNQQLSVHRGEVVEIVPATVLRSECRRRYRPDGPHGANPNRSAFYGDARFLLSLNWDIINSRWFANDEEKRIKHAEVLVPDILPLGKIQGIAVGTRDMLQAVNATITECGLTDRIPRATFKPHLFFQ